MDLVSILGRTVSLLDQANVPTDLRGVAFGKIFDALATEVGSAELPAAPLRGLSTPYAPEQRPAAPGTADPIQLLAMKLGVDEIGLREVYEVENGDLRLIVASGSLEDTRATATQQIALLVACGRQVSGIDPEWTAIEVIRRVVQDYGRFDSANFAATIKAMGDDFAIKGNGAQRSVKITRRGIENAKRFLAQLTRPSETNH